MEFGIVTQEWAGPSVGQYEHRRSLSEQQKPVGGAEYVLGAPYPREYRVVLVIIAFQDKRAAYVGGL